MSREIETEGRLFGLRLKSLRVLSGRTVDEISGDLGISPQSWYGFESGRTVPVATRLPEIARVLGMPLERLTARLLSDDEYVATYQAQQLERRRSFNPGVVTRALVTATPELVSV